MQTISVDGVRIFESTEGFTFAACEDVFIALWKTLPNLEASKHLAAAIETFGQRRPEGLVMLVIVNAANELPDAATREAMARDMKRHESFTRAMALVYEGDGFRAAAVRSVFVGLQMLSRQALPTKVFAAVDEAAAWLVRQRSGPAMTAPEIVTAVDLVRRMPARERISGVDSTPFSRRPRHDD